MISTHHPVLKTKERILISMFQKLKTSNMLMRVFKMKIPLANTIFSNIVKRIDCS